MYDYNFCEFDICLLFSKVSLLHLMLYSIWKWKQVFFGFSAPHKLHQQLLLLLQQQQQLMLLLLLKQKQQQYLQFHWFFTSWLTFFFRYIIYLKMMMIKVGSELLETFKDWLTKKIIIIIYILKKPHIRSYTRVSLNRLIIEYEDTVVWEASN